MPPKKKKTPKLLPGQSLLEIVKTPAPKKYRKVIAAHHPSVQGATHSGDRGHGGMIYRSVSPNGTLRVVGTTITDSDKIHRVAYMVPFDAETKRKLNRAHRKEGVYTDGKIAKAYAQNLKKLATPEERQVMGDEAQDVYNQRSDEKQRKEKQAELDARLKEEKERTEKR